MPRAASRQGGLRSDSQIIRSAEQPHVHVSSTPGLTEVVRPSATTPTKQAYKLTLRHAALLLVSNCTHKAEKRIPPLANPHCYKTEVSLIFRASGPELLLAERDDDLYVT